MIVGEGNIYTPRDGATNERLDLLISDANLKSMTAAGRNARIKGYVIDIPTGIRYRIRGASCGIPTCMCDAIATEVLADTE